MGWRQLITLRDLNRQQAEVERAQGPLECPIDGSPLDHHPDGRRNCPFGNFTWRP